MEVHGVSCVGSGAKWQELGLQRPRHTNLAYTGVFRNHRFDAGCKIHGDMSPCTIFRVGIGEYRTPGHRSGGCARWVAGAAPQPVAGLLGRKR